MGLVVGFTHAVKQKLAHDALTDEIRDLQFFLKEKFQYRSHSDRPLVLLPDEVNCSYNELRRRADIAYNDQEEYFYLAKLCGIYVASQRVHGALDWIKSYRHYRDYGDEDARKHIQCGMPPIREEFRLTEIALTSAEELEQATNVIHRSMRIVREVTQLRKWHVAAFSGEDAFKVTPLRSDQSSNFSVPRNAI